MLTFTENIQADSLSGAIFAIEGIKDACVVLNGPTGCKFYHSAISDSQYLRGLSFDATKYSDSYYMGQARVPSTYLDGHDYVFGSGEKLSAILKEVAREDFRLIAVINSPGAALIGDDLESFLKREVRGIPYFSIENTGYSGSFAEGYQNAMIKALGSIHMNKAKEPKTISGMNMNKFQGPITPGSNQMSKSQELKTRKHSVNLLGFNIYQKYFEENVQALKSLLECCGISVVGVPGAGDKVEELQCMTEADFNVILYPEYGNEIARWMKNVYGTPYLSLEEGPPIGFDGTEHFVKQICHQMGINPEQGMDRINRARAKAYLHLTRYTSLLGLPKGSSFGIKAEASVCYALTKWLCSYLGMIPAVISVLPEGGEESMRKLSDFLKEIDCLEVLEHPLIETPMHILFADGSTIAQTRLHGKRVCGVELTLPSLGYLDVTDKHILGEKGALFLLEQILNGLRFLL